VNESTKQQKLMAPLSMPKEEAEIWAELSRVTLPMDPSEPQQTKETNQA